MGRICFKLDDRYETLIRQQAANFHFSISEFIRQKILQSADLSAKNNSATDENFLALTAEVIELRRCFHKRLSKV